MAHWLESEGYQESPEANLQLWVGGLPKELSAGPWIVLLDEPLSQAQREQWESLLDEESTLLAPWTPTSLRNVLQPSGLLDAAALARLYAQGGRTLADHMVRNFLATAPALLEQCDDEEARYRLHELAGGVGAKELHKRLEEVPWPGWQKLETLLQATCRVLEQQHRQDRTA